MVATLLPLFSLLFSVFILMLGNGLTGILLPVRMGMDATDTSTIGLVMSMYAVGMLLGGLYSRQLVKRAGHSRVFAASAAGAAISILASGLHANEWLMGAMRILTGFGIAAATTTIDSWLSEIASEKTRGRILATNQVVIMGGFITSQFMINLADPASTSLFMVAGILFAAAVIPIALSRQKGPLVEEATYLPFMDLLRASPLGLVTCFFCGVLYTGLLNMLPIYAAEYDISGFRLSLFMGSAMLGAFLLQIPVGALSDRYDRRTVLLFLLVISIAATAMVPTVTHMDIFGMMLLGVALMTGVFGCLYPISVSQTLDRVRQSDIVAALSGLMAAYAVGSIAGPVLASFSMEMLGVDALFYFLLVLQGLLILFVLHRMRVSVALPTEAQEHYVMQAAGISSAPELDPRTEYIEPEMPLSAEAEVAVAVAESNPAAAVKMAKALAANAPEQAAQLTAALAQVEDIEVSRLYAAIIDAAPEMSEYIAEALAAATPEDAEELVQWLVDEKHDRLVEITVAMAKAVPEQGGALIESAAESVAEDSPEMLVELTAGYASDRQEELDGMRPVDREADSTEQEMADLVSNLSDIAPDQASELALTMVEAVPDAATEVTEAYVCSVTGGEDDESGESHVDEAETEAAKAEEVEESLTEYMTQVVEKVPEQAVDVAVVVVEAVPEMASGVVDMLNEADAVEPLMQDIDDRPEESALQSQAEEEVAVAVADKEGENNQLSRS
ncbi:MFS transporter [Marinobacterium jannaschii]|uniref:MFS transporter n=1 Tax=Marinobacterium jannaschii TaxID=64970 RepID=UPI00048601F4|nr:MFS transporter [Marinobacterium jannaschii]